jgi:hypothetical protein
MARTDPKRWTKEEIEKLIEMASQEDATLKKIARHYYLAESTISAVLKKAGANRFLSKERKIWRLNKTKKEKKENIRDLLVKSKGNISAAAKLGNYGRSVIEKWARVLFTKEELRSFTVYPACIECGKPIKSSHPNAKMCSGECKKNRTNKLRAKVRGKSWQLWQKRDYDELLITLKNCGGSASKAAVALGVTRHSVHGAIARWNLQADVEDIKRESLEQKIQHFVEMLKNGLAFNYAAAKANLDRNKVKEYLTERGYENLLGTQKCLNCGMFFKRQKVQERCCSSECQTERRKKKLKKNTKKQKVKTSKVIVEKDLIKKSKYL